LGEEGSLFRCGEDAVDHYFQTQATQDIRRRIADCFVAVEVVTNRAPWRDILRANRSAPLQSRFSKGRRSEMRGF
jgi:hypothetical protein